MCTDVQLGFLPGYWQCYLPKAWKSKIKQNDFNPYFSDDLTKHIFTPDAF